jgi:hypothetical protein
MSRRLTYAVLGLLCTAAVALIAIELANGALSYGDPQTQDPCTATVSFPGSGLDATIQRVVLSGLNGAACDLDVTREELVLSLDPSVATKQIPWDQATIERAVRSGLLRATDDAEARGSLSSLTAFVMREVIERAPIGWLLDQGGSLADLFG